MDTVVNSTSRSCDKERWKHARFIRLVQPSLYQLRKTRLTSIGVSMRLTYEFMMEHSVSITLLLRNAGRVNPPQRWGPGSRVLFKRRLNFGTRNELKKMIN